MSDRSSQKRVTIRISPQQAKILWGIVDGALDAGACADGLSRKESNALNAVCTQILSQITPHKIKSDDVDTIEAATDLLAAFDKDQRTVGYRNDLWECLRAAISEGE